MLILCIVLLIPLLVLLVAMIIDKQKHPEDYEIPKRRKKPRRRSSDHLPPLTAWTWWRYAELNNGRYPDAAWRRKYFERHRRK